MLIKPFDSEQVEMPLEIQQILESSGLSAPVIDPKNKSDVRKVFNDAGASVENAADQISKVMSHGETDAGRLKAAELILKVHGVVNEIDGNNTPNITINILGQNNKSLINLVLPTT